MRREKNRYIFAPEGRRGRERRHGLRKTLLIFLPLLAAILLISVLVGAEYGSIFVLVASTLYWFSGSAPGAYCIALLCFASIAVSLFRQAYWRRGFSSTVLCAGTALMIYEIGVFLAGMLLGLTQWGRFYRFALTGAMSWAVMIPLYPLCFKIGLIGGQPWKE